MARGRSGTWATSIVSSSLLGKMAAAAGQPYVETLTGFKWIGRVPGLAFGYEEALGYCCDPDHVKDKDGVSALLLLCELAAETKAAGRTLVDVLDDLAVEHGLHATDQVSVRVADLSLITAAMERLRATPPTELGGLAVERVDDLALGSADLPADRRAAVPPRRRRAGRRPSERDRAQAQVLPRGRRAGRRGGRASTRRGSRRRPGWTRWAGTSRPRWGCRKPSWAAQVSAVPAALAVPSMTSPSPMPSIQTSFEIAVPCWVGQMLPGLCMPSVRRYMVRSAPEKPVRAAPAIAGGTTGASRRRADRHLPDGEQLEEVGWLHLVEHGECTRRHAVHARSSLPRSRATSPSRRGGCRRQWPHGWACCAVSSGLPETQKVVGLVNYTSRSLVKRTRVRYSAVQLGILGRPTMGNWQLDPYHTQVEFAAKHLGMMTVRGHFADVTSTADIDPDHPEAMSGRGHHPDGQHQDQQRGPRQGRALGELPRHRQLPGHDVQEHGASSRPARTATP